MDERIFEELNLAIFRAAESLQSLLDKLDADQEVEPSEFQHALCPPLTRERRMGLFRVSQSPFLCKRKFRCKVPAEVQ